MPYFSVAEEYGIFFAPCRAIYRHFGIEHFKGMELSNGKKIMHTLTP